MEPHEEMTLTTVISPQDDLDSEIVNDTINMVMALNMNDILVMGDKKLGEDLFGKSLDLAQSLLKANAHLRTYLTKEVGILATQKEKGQKDPNTNTHIGFNPVDLNNEIDGVLSQIKASLDTLAKMLNPLFGFSLNGWHKKGEMSGGEILKVIENNMPKQFKDKSKDLSEYIEKNAGYVSYIVWLRDQANHRGGIKGITSVIFNYKTQDVVPQKIIHPDKTEEYVRDFLLRTIEMMKSFINGVLVLSMHLKMGSGLVIVKNDKGTHPPYSWGIPNTSIKS